MKESPFRDGWTEADIDAVIARGDPAELLYVPLVVSMSPPSRAYAEQTCLRFATHPDANVRGLSIEGFGNIARIFRALNKSLIFRVVQAARQDSDEWVRGKAEDAADEIEWLLGWEFPGREGRRARPLCPPNRLPE
jgi:hypothetical protein